LFVGRGRRLWYGDVGGVRPTGSGRRGILVVLAWEKGGFPARAAACPAEISSRISAIDNSVRGDGAECPGGIGKYFPSLRMKVHFMRMPGSPGYGSGGSEKYVCAPLGYPSQDG
jgi:hypothetical protein